MEVQSDERVKTQYLGTNHWERQIQQLQQDLDAERNERIKVL